MSVLIVASAQPRAGRSLIAAALAYRFGRDGRAVTLARLAGDDSAEHDAAAFVALDGIVAPAATVQQNDVASLTGNVIVEAPPGSVGDLASTLDAKVLAVSEPASASLDLPANRLLGVVLTRAPASTVDAEAQRDGVVAVIPEDEALAAPSVADMATALDAKWLSGEDTSDGVGRVMIGTVASDAATPYFAQRVRPCVVTRFDKTDIQLAALHADAACLLLTGGGEPSPYLIDRVSRDDVAVILTAAGTVDAVRSLEGLFGNSRFAGEAKLARAVQLLDERAVTLQW